MNIKYAKILTKLLLEDLYIKYGSANKIGKHLNIPTKTIIIYLDKFNIKRKLNSKVLTTHEERLFDQEYKNFLTTYTNVIVELEPDYSLTLKEMQEEFYKYYGLEKEHKSFKSNMENEKKENEFINEDPTSETDLDFDVINSATEIKEEEQIMGIQKGGYKNIDKKTFRKYLLMGIGGLFIIIIVGSVAGISGYYVIKSIWYKPSNKTEIYKYIQN